MEDGWENYVYDGMNEVVAVRVTRYEKEPTYTNAANMKDPDGNPRAVFDIEEQTIALTMDVPQKRMSAMIVTSYESWAKSASQGNGITIKIEQNSFDPTNYRYVIPHSYYSFGLKTINIDDFGKYRTKYYADYFSTIVAGQPTEPAIKEADTMTMLLKWEEYANSGNETAYAFMRDLYKLIMYIREEGNILETAYSYLYVPESIWDFREGVTQEKFWTECLASMSHGEDALSYEELHTMTVKKNEILWQIVDYDSYEECFNEETNKHMIYGMFIHGNEFIRAWFMQRAILTGTFYEGDFKEGHGGADWAGRARTRTILSMGNIAERPEEVEMAAYWDVYDSEIKRRTVAKIINSSGSYSDSISVAKGFLDTGVVTRGTAYNEAKAELDAELEKYAVFTPVVAAAPGLVTKAHYNCYGGFTSTVIYTNKAGVDKNGQTRVAYSHMKRWPSVQVDDYVGPGTVIGYEGTTGNSGGYHVHVTVHVKHFDEADSPSEYFGPLFTPFFNTEKAAEVLTQFSDQRLALSSEYYSLVRTVIPPLSLFDSNTGKLTVETGKPIDVDGIIYIEDANIIENGVIDGVEGEIDYLEYDLSKLGKQDPKRVAIETDTKNKFIVGRYEPSGDTTETVLKYYIVNVEDLPEITGYSRTSSPARLKITGKQQINVDDPGAVKEGVAIRTGLPMPITYEYKNIIWGNNTPLRPLAEDTKDGFNINILSLQKAFTPNPAEYSGDRTPREEIEAWVKENQYGDVRAFSEYFDSSSNAVKGKTGVPAYLLLMLADVENPDAIPFYDGPISVEYANMPISYGEAGTQIADLQRLQEILKQRGYDPEDKMNTDGIYDDATQEVIMNAAKSISSLTPYVGHAAGTGEAGEYNAAKKSFDVRFLVGWNEYVTYGSDYNGDLAGRLATSYAAVQTGLEPLFVAAVANRESGFTPTNESNEFANGGNFADASTPTPPKVTFRGYDIVIRRAQGVMQLTVGTAFGRCRQKGITDEQQILAMMRTPMTNALIGAEYLHDNIQSLRNDATLNARVESISQQQNWKNLSSASKGISSRALLEYACSCIMYNKGPGGFRSGDYLDKLANMTFTKDPSSGRVTVNTNGAGYSADVLNYIINGGN